MLQEQLRVPTKVRSAAGPGLWAQSPEFESGEANPRSEEQEWHKDIEWLAKGHLIHRQQRPG